MRKVTIAIFGKYMLGTSHFTQNSDPLSDGSMNPKRNFFSELIPWILIIIITLLINIL